MRFDCGPTWQEKHERLSNWHDFFCLWPRRVEGRQCAWLETIQRKGEGIDAYEGGVIWLWEYRFKP